MSPSLRVRARSFLAVALVLVTPTVVRAQETIAPAGGLWLSVSAAAAGARLTCDVCDPTRDSGPAVEASIGTYATAAVRVGIDAGAWTFRDGDFRETIWTAGLAAEVHPSASRGLYLVGGLGWMGYRANDVDADPDEAGFSYDAARLRLGVGWDLPMSASWTVGNRVTLDASSLGTLHDGGAAVASSVGLSVIRFAVYVRYR